MDQVNNPQDEFFKAVFSDISIAKNFLENYLPIEVRDVVNLDCLEVEKESLVDKEMKEYHSDLLFCTELSGKKAYILLLLEHKTPQYIPMSIQIMRYMIKIWDKELTKNKDKKLPVIIPLVIRLGENKCKIPLNLDGIVYN